MRVTAVTGFTDIACVCVRARVEPIMEIPVTLSPAEGRTSDFSYETGAERHGTTLHQPVTNPSPGAARRAERRREGGGVVGTPKSAASAKGRDRGLTPLKQTTAAALIDWMGKLTLSGGDLDGQRFEVWPWERRFLKGTFRQPGNAALSIARGGGKSNFVAAWAAAGSGSRRAASRNAARGGMRGVQLPTVAHHLRGRGGVRPLAGPRPGRPEQVATPRLTEHRNA